MIGSVDILAFVEESLIAGDPHNSEANPKAVIEDNEAEKSWYPGDKGNNNNSVGEAKNLEFYLQVKKIRVLLNFLKDPVTKNILAKAGSVFGGGNCDLKRTRIIFLYH